MLALSLVGFGLWLYTLAGYPLLMRTWARVRGPRPAPPDAPSAPALGPALTVAIPSHAGAPWLGAKLASVLAQRLDGDAAFEVLVYLDGPDPGARALVTAAAATDPRVRLIEGPARAGKPTALNALAAAARGALLVFTDVRPTLAPGALAALARALADPKIGVASGALALTGPDGAGAYWRYEQRLRAAESACRGMVGATGPLFALRRADFRPLPADVVLDDVWLPMALTLAGRRTRHVPEATALDAAAPDGRELARKVRTLAGNAQLFLRLPRLLSPWANPLWFETVSHKLLRLALPLSLAAWLAPAPALAAAPPSPTVAFAVASLATAGAAAALAALGPRLGRPGRLARTALLLHLAALLGLWRGLRGRQPVRW